MPSRPHVRNNIKVVCLEIMKLVYFCIYSCVTIKEVLLKEKREITNDRRV